MATIKITNFALNCLRLANVMKLSYCCLHNLLGTGHATKSGDFFKKFQRAFDPPPIFWKTILQFFYNGYGCIYASKRAR